VFIGTAIPRTAIRELMTAVVGLLVGGVFSFTSLDSVWAQPTEPSRRQVVPGGTPKKAQATRPVPSTLEVKEFSKEFETWSKSTTISSPGSLTFRWSAKNTAITSATWVVLDAPLSESYGRSRGPKTLAQGNLSPIPHGGYNIFEIKFASFIPKWPPAAPGFYTYWVYLRTYKRASQGVGVEPEPVRIVYRAPGEAPSINVCTKHSDCPVGFVCYVEKKRCEINTYRCIDDHVIVGTDGTRTDCSPYRCVAATCRTSCSSVDDCWNSDTSHPSNVCDPDSDRCVSLR